MGRGPPKAARHTIQTHPTVATVTSRVGEAPTPYYWTLDDYHAAIDAGIFGDQRVELLHGEIVEMPPMGEPHIAAVGYLADVFISRLGWRRALSQTPIVLPSDGEPEPDVAVREHGASPKPRVEQVQLVIEVAQSSRQRDLGTKLVDYLRDGLRELWIIDLVEQCALIYRGGLLVARHPRGSGARLTAELVPEVTVDLDEVFEAARLASP
jgi:Uma2 family endonuclease